MRPGNVRFVCASLVVIAKWLFFFQCVCLFSFDLALAFCDWNTEKIYEKIIKRSIFRVLWKGKKFRQKIVVWCEQTKNKKPVHAIPNNTPAATMPWTAQWYDLVWCVWSFRQSLQLLCIYRGGIVEQINCWSTNLRLNPSGREREKGSIVTHAKQIVSDCFWWNKIAFG